MIRRKHQSLGNYGDFGGCSEGAFGMDVEGMRRYKNLTGTGRNLSDHMSARQQIEQGSNKKPAAA